MLWRDLHGNLAVYLEGMRRYPVAYYFHTRHRNRSLPAMLRLIGEAAAAVRWCLPSDHPAVRDPWLPGLLEVYQQASREISGRFLTILVPSPAPATDRAHFEAGIDGTATGPPDPTVEAFRRVCATMAALTPTGDRACRDLFERYRAWWGFAGPARAFVNSVAADFGALPVLAQDDAEPSAADATTPV